MLKKYNILIVIAFVAIISFQGMEKIFASDDGTAEALAVTVGAKKTVSITVSNEIGVSGSYLSSRFSRSTGDIENATKSLLLVYKKNHKDLYIASQLMGLYLLGGHVDKAMEMASNIAKANPKEAISALMLSLQEIKNNDILKASRILNSLSEDEGDQLWLPLISAWLDVDKKKLSKPLSIKDLSAKVGRAAPIVNYHLALINAKAGFTKAAARNFKKSMSGSNYQSMRSMQMLLQFYKENNSPKILKPLVDIYNKTNPNALKVKTVLVDNAKDGAAEVLLTMGSIMLQAEVVQDATLYLQLALYLNPNIDVATIKLALSYGELKKYGIANELLEKIKSKSQFYNKAQLYIAINLGRLKKIDQAIAKLDELISKSPKDIEAYMAKGNLLRSQKKFKSAITMYKSALSTLKKEKAQHWSIFFAIGTSFDKQGNWVEAEKNLRRSLELSPNQPDVLNYLGYSFLIRGENLAHARRLIEGALKKRSKDPQIIDSMGWALYVSGEYKKAVKFLEIAISLLPADATVNEHLGDVYWRLGRRTEARFQWEKSLIYSKDDKFLQTVRKKLKYGLPLIKSDVDASREKKNIVPMNTALNERSL